MRLIVAHRSSIYSGRLDTVLPVAAPSGRYAPGAGEPARHLPTCQDYGYLAWREFLPAVKVTIS
jgi:hypothetical protein